MATAKDVMTADPVVLESSALITDAVALFKKHRISSAAVQSTMGDIVGTLTELGLVRALVLNQLQPEKYSKLAHCMELLTNATFCEPKDSITHVIKCMIKSPTQRVLVKSDGRKVLGVISPKDMLRVLLGGEEEAHAVQSEIGKLGDKKL